MNKYDNVNFNLNSKKISGKLRKKTKILLLLLSVENIEVPILNIGKDKVCCTWIYPNNFLEITVSRESYEYFMDKNQRLTGDSNMTLESIFVKLEKTLRSY